jgi:transposase-like protein
LTRPGISALFGPRGCLWWHEPLQALPPHTAYTLAGLLDTLERLHQQIDHVEQRMHEACHRAREVDLLMTWPGAGYILSVVITSEIGDVRRFQGADHLASSAGTTPRVHASGGKTRDGPLRPDVNRDVTWAFVEAANASCRVRRRHPHRHVSQRYERLARPKGPQKAIGAVARHVAEATYWLLSTGDPDREPRSRRALGSSTEASARAGELSAWTLDSVMATCLRHTFMPQRWRREAAGETRTKRKRHRFHFSLARRFQRCSLLRHEVMERSTLWLTHRRSAMHKRTWDAKVKALIVIEGLKGKPVADICHEHQIRQSQYYQWRDQLLAHAAQACEVHQHTRKEARLEQANTQLKRLVGELTLELKNSDELLG